MLAKVKDVARQDWYIYFLIITRFLGLSRSVQKLLKTNNFISQSDIYYDYQVTVLAYLIILCEASKCICHLILLLDFTELPG